MELYTIRGIKRYYMRIYTSLAMKWQDEQYQQRGEDGEAETSCKVVK